MAQKRKSLGPGFSEEVIRTTATIGHFKNVQPADWIDALLPNFHPQEKSLSGQNIWRVTSFSVICLVLFFIIFLRLFHLQIVEGRINKELADGNRIRVKIIHAPRGVIFDRNGQVLAANAPAFRLNDPNSSAHKIRLVTREQAVEWEVKNDPRVLDLEVDHVRTYLKAFEFAHAVGFMGEVSSDQLKLPEFGSYRSGDAIGQIGVEAEYEKILRGRDGGEIIEVDSLGHRLRTLRSEPAIPGQNIYLSLDASLQEKLYFLIKDALIRSGSCCGVGVAQDPKDGKVLALVSFPSFNPNIFARNEDENAIGEILSRSDSPLLNRAIGGVYPPGSTFKIVSSLAALSSGVSPGMTIEDDGVTYLGPYRFTNWYFNQYGKVEGAVNLQKALMRSNDTYFYKISQIIGEQAIAAWSRKLHLGTRLEIDIPGEETGLIPDDAWKKKTYGIPWYPGDTLHMAIGQGFVLTTPLQVLGITSFVAEEGTLYKPGLLLSEKPQILVANLLPKEQIRLIKEGLKLVPKSGGTAWPFFTFPLETAGKTGTAEYGDPKGKTHAWYTSFAPATDPKIALTILIEGGGEGSSVAAPIAKEVYRWYFSPDKNKLIQDIYTPATDSGKTLGE